MSLLVVIKGPVAKAGSMPNLFSNNGTNVPIKDAIIITEIKETVTVIPNSIFTLSKKWLPANKITAKITPFKRLSEISLIKRFQSDPLMVLFAKPCTIIAED